MRTKGKPIGRPWERELQERLAAVRYKSSRPNFGMRSFSDHHIEAIRGDLSIFISELIQEAYKNGISDAERGLC